MIIYADITFLLNFCIDFILLLLVSGIRRQRVKNFNLIIASFVGGIYSVLYLWPQFSFFYLLVIKILISFLMIWLTFGFKSINNFVLNLGVFYLLCFIFGGAIISLHYILNGSKNFAYGREDSISWLLIVTSFPLVWLYVRISFNSLRENSKIHNYITSLKILIENHTISCQGLIDTGNQLFDPITKKPVIMLEIFKVKKILPENFIKAIKEKKWDNLAEGLPLSWLRKISLVSYRVAGHNSNTMLTLKPQEVEIFFEHSWYKVTNVLIGIDVGPLSPDGTYQAIINPSCLSFN